MTKETVSNFLIKNKTIEKFHVICQLGDEDYFENFVRTLGFQLVFLGQDKHYTGFIFALLPEDENVTKKTIRELKKEVFETKGLKF